MEIAEGQDAPIRQEEKLKAAAISPFERTDVLLMMSMAVNVFLAVLVVWWAVTGSANNSGSASARNVERDISRLNAAIERLEHTVERKAVEAERAAPAGAAPLQADAGAAGQPAAGAAVQEGAPKTHRVLLPDGRLVIKTIQ